MQTSCERHRWWASQKDICLGAASVVNTWGEHQYYRVCWAGYYLKNDMNVYNWGLCKTGILGGLDSERERETVSLCVRKDKGWERVCVCMCVMYHYNYCCYLVQYWSRPMTIISLSGMLAPQTSPPILQLSFIAIFVATDIRPCCLEMVFLEHNLRWDWIVNTTAFLDSLVPIFFVVGGNTDNHLHILS